MGNSGPGDDDSYRLLRNETRVKIFDFGFRKKRRPESSKRNNKRGVSGSGTTGGGVSLWVLGGVVLTVVVTGLLLVWHARRPAAAPPPLTPPDPLEPPPPSASRLQIFGTAAVCTDGPPCSKIGRDILKQGGNAVDAALAALFCNGVVNSQSMGLGGGFLMTLYVKGKGYSVLAREQAPSAAHKDMFKDDPELSKTGGLAVGVPGELLGYWEVWKKFGSLKWNEILQPTIDLCRDGYYMSSAQYDSLLFRPDLPKSDIIMTELFVDPFSGNYMKPGTFIKPKKICNTLETIAEEGGMALNNGSLTKGFVEDIREKGGIITENDMINYRVDWKEPETLTLHTGHKVHTVGPPGSGNLLLYALALLDGFEMGKFYANRSEVTSPHGLNSTLIALQRTIEAFKFSFAKRPELADPKFVDIKKVLSKMKSKKYIEEVRSKIKDDATSNDGKYYGSVDYSTDDHGTAHLSILSKEGDAISVTSTINLYFGAGFTSTSTGIIPNSVMDDFSIPGRVNYFSLKPTPNHFVSGSKRPLSSACPSIVTDKQGNVVLVIGASGGTKIPTAVAWVMIRHLWFGENIKEAVDASRIHHQLFPMRIEYEYGLLEQFVKGLESKGHETFRYRERGSIVCAISKQNGKVFANADFRKGGEVYGL